MNFDWAAGATLLVCAIFGAGYIFKLIDRLTESVTSRASGPNK